MSSNIVPIANTLLHPPLGALRRELITGVYSGSGDLTRPGGFPPFENVNAYGLTWSFFTVPETFGYQLGSPRPSRMASTGYGPTLARRGCTTRSSQP